MLKALILICAIGVDHSSCNPHTASGVYNAALAATPQACIMAGQTALAQAPGSGSIQYDRTKEYVKIACVREQVVEQRDSREALVRGGPQ